MADYVDLFENISDWLVLGAGLVTIIVIVLRSSRPAIRQSPAAVVGVVVWLTIFMIALYLIFGSHV